MGKRRIDDEPLSLKLDENQVYSNQEFLLHMQGLRLINQTGPADLLEILDNNIEWAARLPEGSQIGFVRENGMTYPVRVTRP